MLTDRKTKTAARATNPATMGFLDDHLKVREAVVIAYAIAMVDKLIGFELPAEVLFHDETVLSGVSLPATSQVHTDIPVTRNPAPTDAAIVAAIIGAPSFLERVFGDVKRLAAVLAVFVFAVSKAKPNAFGGTVFLLASERWAVMMRAEPLAALFAPFHFHAPILPFSNPNLQQRGGR